MFDTPRILFHFQMYLYVYCIMYIVQTLVGNGPYFQTRTKMTRTGSRSELFLLELNDIKIFLFSHKKQFELFTEMCKTNFCRFVSFFSLFYSPPRPWVLLHYLYSIPVWSAAPQTAFFYVVWPKPFWKVGSGQKKRSRSATQVKTMT